MGKNTENLEANTQHQQYSNKECPIYWGKGEVVKRKPFWGIIFWKKLLNLMNDLEL